MDRYQKLFEGCIAVDLDNTLAQYEDGYFEKKIIGEPIPEMLNRVKDWLAQGKEVKIFTARASDPESIPVIEAWCIKNIGRSLPITNVKTPDVEEIWDDKSINPLVAKRKEDLEDLLNIQLSPSNIKSDDYMHGLSNGLILAHATVMGYNPQFIESYKPFFEKWIKSVETVSSINNKKEYVEIFLNPSVKELQDIKKSLPHGQKLSGIRAFYSSPGNLYCFRGDIFHTDIISHLPKIVDMSPLYPVSIEKNELWVSDVMWGTPEKEFIDLINEEYEIFHKKNPTIKLSPMYFKKKNIKESTVYEAKQVGILYHFTNKFDKLFSILRTMTLKSDLGYISLTRNFDLGRADNANFGNLRITLDGNRLSNKYRITPFHDIEGINKDFKRDVQRKEYTEYEEKIDKPSIDISGSIIEIQILRTPHDKYDKKFQVNVDTLKEIYPDMPIKIIDGWHFRPYKYAIKEFTVYDWKNKLTSVTYKTYADRKKLKGVLDKGVQFVDFDKAHSMAKFLVQPTFSFGAEETGLAGEFKHTNAYEVDVEFINYEDWIDNWQNATIEDFKDLLKVCDVKLHCTCPFWYWGGLRYQATEYDSAVYPLYIPDKHWHDKNEPGLPGICKHQQGVIVKMLRFPQQVFKDIQRKLGVKPKPMSKEIPEPVINRMTPQEIQKKVLPEPEIKPVGKSLPKEKKLPEPEVLRVSKPEKKEEPLPEPEINIDDILDDDKEDKNKDKNKKESSVSKYKSLFESHQYEYPLSKNEIEGLEILDDIPNTSSISASLNDYTVLKGIREVPFSDFNDPNKIFYAVNDFERSKRLANAIELSGQIKPLIVVIDKEGPYILEGAHRFLALHLLGKKIFPALVVVDKDNNNYEEI